MDSPYHGFNLCCGTTAEGLDDPATELIPIVRWIGERKRLFNIHFRVSSSTALLRTADLSPRLQFQLTIDGLLAMTSL